MNFVTLVSATIIYCCAVFMGLFVMFKNSGFLILAMTLFFIVAYRLLRKDNVRGVA